MNENNIETFNLSYFDANDWDSLYEMVKMVNADPKEGEATADQIILDIEDVRSGKKPSSILSNDFDLRDVVDSLMGGEEEVAA